MDEGDKPMIVVDYMLLLTCLPCSETCGRLLRLITGSQCIMQPLINTTSNLNDTQQQAILLAAINVGFKAMEFITEPNVKAIASHLKKRTLKEGYRRRKELVGFSRGLPFAKKGGKTFSGSAKTIGKILPGLVAITAVIAENLENLG